MTMKFFKIIQDSELYFRDAIVTSNDENNCCYATIDNYVYELNVFKVSKIKLENALKSGIKLENFVNSSGYLVNKISKLKPRGFAHGSDSTKYLVESFIHVQEISYKEKHDVYTTEGKGYDFLLAFVCVTDSKKVIIPRQEMTFRKLAETEKIFDYIRPTVMDIDCESFEILLGEPEQEIEIKEVEPENLISEKEIKDEDDNIIVYDEPKYYIISGEEGEENIIFEADGENKINNTMFGRNLKTDISLAYISKDKIIKSISKESANSMVSESEDNEDDEDIEVKEPDELNLLDDETE